MSLGDDVAGEPLAPVVVVASRAGEIELALAAVEEIAAGGGERCEPRVRRRGDRHAAGLARHEGRKRQQLRALEAQRRRLLALAAADVDLPFEIDRTPARGVEGRIARRDALHALRGIAVAVGAGAAGGASLLVPQRLAV